jgi:hypothetical protein
MALIRIIEPGRTAKKDRTIAEGHGRWSRVIHCDERKESMTIRKVEIDRLSVTSSKPFEVVVAALKAAIGHPDSH